MTARVKELEAALFDGKLDSVAELTQLVKDNFNSFSLVLRSCQTYSSAASAPSVPAELLDSFVRPLLSILHHNDVRLQIAATHSLFNIIEDTADLEIANQIFQHIVTVHKANPNWYKDVQKRFINGQDDLAKHFLLFVRNSCDDLDALVTNVRTTLSAVDFLEPQSDNDTREAVLRNMFQLLSKVTSKDTGSVFVAKEPDAKRLKTGMERSRGSLLSQAWLSLLGTKLPLDVYEKALLNIASIIDNISQPLMIADFLSRSYDIGGEIAMLSIEGMFVLITEYNFEYPEFFDSLYRLLKPHIFRSPHHKRFLDLLSTCLGSIYLSQQIVSAFMKKLSRLSLTAPPSGVRIIASIIGKLLCQSNSAELLRNRTEPQSEGCPDPFKDNGNLQDPGVLKSSIWELKASENHYIQKVAKLCKTVTTTQTLDKNLFKKLPLEDDWEKMFTKLAGKKKAPVEYRKKERLFESPVFEDCWAC